MLNKIKSPIDIRDYEAKDFLDFSYELPKKYKSKRIPVRCQWLSNKCVTFSITSALNYIFNTRKKFSANYLYTLKPSGEDDGWYIREGLKYAQDYGCVLAKDFSENKNYIKAKRFYRANKEELDKKASQYRIKSYFKCNTEEEIKRCIMKYGCVLSGCDVRGLSWFLRPRITKKVLDKKVICGHAFIIVGWTEDSWIVQDSYSIVRPILGRFKIEKDYPLDEFFGISMEASKQCVKEKKTRQKN